MRLLIAAVLLGTAVCAQAQAPQAKPAFNPVTDRAAALREAASLLEKAQQAKERGNRNYAEQLFTSAEAIVGADAVAEIAHAVPRGRAAARDHAAQDAADDDAAAAGRGRQLRRGRARSQAQARLAHRHAQGRRQAVRGEPAVITLEPANGNFKRRTPVHRTVEQRGREFAPHILAVPTGSTVGFPNFDTIFHNVFSRSDAAAFDLGNYRNGQSREYTFDKDGIVRLGCNLHSNMQAFVVVVSQPHYVLTDTSGRFKFRSLEPGKYKMRVFSERSEPSVQEIVVKPTANEVAFDVHGHAAPPATDKFGVARGR